MADLAQLKQVVEAIDIDHAGKLDKLVKIYESKQAPEKIVEAVSDFMETYLEEVMPKAAMINEARLNRLEKMYGTMKQLLVVNDEYVSTEVKEAVEDANSQIASKDKEIDKLMLEKVELKKKIGEIEAAMTPLPDNASEAMRRVPEIDPFESEEYQRFVESMVPHCHCRASNCPCDGVLAGGLCDNMTDDERESLFDDAEDGV